MGTDEKVHSHGTVGQDRFAWHLLCACGEYNRSVDQLSRRLMVTAWRCEECGRWNAANFKNHQEVMEMHDRMVRIASQHQSFRDFALEMPR